VRDLKTTRINKILEKGGKRNGQKEQDEWRREKATELTRFVKEGKD